MLRHLFLAILAVTLLILTPALPAQEYVGRGDVEIGFDVGGTRFDSDFDDDTNVRGGIRLGVFLTDHLHVEAEVSRNDLDILDTEITTYMLNAAWNFQQYSTLVPYVQVGAGVGEYRYDEFPGDLEIDDSGLALKGAVGTRIFFGNLDRLALKVEAGVQMIDVLDSEEVGFNLGVGLAVRLGS